MAKAFGIEAPGLIVVLAASLAVLGWAGKLWGKREIERAKAQYAAELEEAKADYANQLERAKSQYAGKLEEAKADSARNLEQLRTDLGLQTAFATWPMAREDALAAEFRKSVQEVMTPLMSAIHSVAWHTWPAIVAPAEITSDWVKAYETEVHSFLPRISANVALVAAYSKTTYDLLRTRVDSVYDLDVETGTAFRDLLVARKANDAGTEAEAVANLLKIKDKAKGLESSVPQDLADAIPAAVKARAEEVENDRVQFAQRWERSAGSSSPTQWRSPAGISPSS
jgi:hypothetical protein